MKISYFIFDFILPIVLVIILGYITKLSFDGLEQGYTLCIFPPSLSICGIFVCVIYFILSITRNT